jgi:hypothetical protein
MYNPLESASPVQPTVQRVDGVPTLERHELGSNLCSNADFTSGNDTDGAIYSGEVRSTQWFMYSPVFISPVDYKQGFNFNYILPYQPYQNTTSLVDLPTNWNQIPVGLHRGVKMFGLGNDFSLALNQDANRSYTTGGGETPIVGITDNSTTVSSTTSWGDTGTWTRYDRFQTVTTTADSVTFGAWVRCDPNDALRALNMGGLYLWQDVSTSLTGGRTIEVSAMVVKRSANTASFRTGSLPHPQGGEPQGHFNWSGMNHRYGENNWQYTNTDKYRWNDTCTVDNLDTYDAEDLATWTRIEQTVTLSGSGLKRIGVAMFFAENCSYLLANDGELTGSIDFYSPYVIPASAEVETSFAVTSSTGGTGGVSVTVPSDAITEADKVDGKNFVAVPFTVTVDAGKIVEKFVVTGASNKGAINLYMGVNYNNLNGRQEDSTSAVRFQIYANSTNYDARLKQGTHSGTLYIARGQRGPVNIQAITIDE